MAAAFLFSPLPMMIYGFLGKLKTFFQKILKRGDVSFEKNRTNARRDFPQTIDGSLCRRRICCACSVRDALLWEHTRALGSGKQEGARFEKGKKKKMNLLVKSQKCKKKRTANSQAQSNRRKEGEYAGEGADKKKSPSAATRDISTRR
jgi:hypothetical protein